MAMTMESAEALVDALEQYNIYAELRESYSGRGMYGDTVPALVFDDEAPRNWWVTLGYAAAEAGIDYKDLPTREDSMGRGSVVY